MVVVAKREIEELLWNCQFKEFTAVAFSRIHSRFHPRIQSEQCAKRSRNWWHDDMEEDVDAMWLLDPFWPFSLLVDYNISIPEGIHGRKYQIKYSWLKKSKECDHFIFIFPFCLCLVIHIPFLPLVSKQDPQRHSWAEVKAAAGTIPTSTSFQHFHHQHHHYHHWANCGLLQTQGANTLQKAPQSVSLQVFRRISFGKSIFGSIAEWGIAGLFKNSFCFFSYSGTHMILCMCKKKNHRGQIVSLSKQAYNGAKVNITGSTIEVQKLKVLHTKMNTITITY